MKYTLLSLTPSWLGGINTEILRIKKIPNIIGKKLGQIEEIRVFYLKSVIFNVEGDRTLRWYYYPLENIREQPVNNKILERKLDSFVGEWRLWNYNNIWKEIEEEYLYFLEMYREDLDNKISEKEKLAKQHKKGEISEDEYNKKCKEISEEIEDTLEQIEYMENESYNWNAFEYDENLDDQKNGTYKYMNIHVFRWKYKIEKSSFKKSILILDDEEGIRLVLKEALNLKLNNKIREILTVTNGNRALKIIDEKEGKIDLIQLDLNHPGIGGVKLIKIIRNNFPQIKILVCTASYSEKMDLIKNGLIDDILLKPFEIYKYIYRIELLLS